MWDKGGRVAEWGKGRAPMPVVLSTFEVSRVVGMRALQLSAGASPLVEVDDESLRLNPAYVAARELYDGLLDFRVRLADGECVDTRTAATHPSLASFLDTTDGGERFATARLRG
jgi:DNA-directed RNA polymerase subunit K/omega